MPVSPRRSAAAADSDDPFDAELAASPPARATDRDAAPPAGRAAPRRAPKRGADGRLAQPAAA
ncbi:hypothetical protein KGP92_29675, partial [Burkholderia multivorans]